MRVQGFTSCIFGCLRIVKSGTYVRSSGSEKIHLQRGGMQTGHAGGGVLCGRGKHADGAISAGLFCALQAAIGKA
jgi:hypothetical protein